MPEAADDSVIASSPPFVDLRVLDQHDVAAIHRLRHSRSKIENRSDPIDSSDEVSIFENPIYERIYIYIT
jgi:hypothetical protein